MSIRAQASVHTFQELHSNCVQAIMNGQVIQAEGIKAEMSRHFQDVKAETDKLNAATGKIATLQAKVVKMNETMLDLQKMTLDRLANIQTQIQAVLTQTYELHEYPIPRLFIILPKMARKRDTLLKPFSNQFRLYFLCECGLHTTKEGSKEIDQVHLANHPGYDIDRPTEFLNKYGPYVLAVMRAVQLGARIASMIVPHLANSTLAHELKVAELGLKTLQEGVDFYTKENIGMMVDKTVLYLEDLNKYHDEQEVEGDARSSMSQSILDDAKAIEGVELKQFANFLSVADNGHMLGNLYRSVTKEGHAKWVCRTHYRQNYREEARRLFYEVVEENRGLFEEQKGKLTISLASRTLANAFYTVLIQVQFVQELDICFLWDYTQADLRVFTQAILESTIVSLSFDGKDFVGPPSDLFNRGRRYDPLLQLLADGRLWMARFANLGVGHSGDALTYYDFLGRTSNLYTIKVVPMLRALDMSQVVDDAGLILELTRKCISLQKLSVSMRRGDFILKCIETCPSLQQLEVYRRNLGDLTVKDILDLIDRVVALKIAEQKVEKDSALITLTKVNLKSTVLAKIMDVATMQVELAARAPLAKLTILDDS
ncbi:hypothetical protein BGZ81_007823 [Podila clonocystis]|nr:hypothetical protein BGZ81_007823 [Podila clonocystis]